MKNGILYIEKIKREIKENKEAAVSIAPSYPAAFGQNKAGRLVSALKKLGFSRVEETVYILPKIIKLRSELVKHSEIPILGNSCPRIVKMIYEEFPHLVSCLPSFHSPMVAHCSSLKQRFGKDIITVFIGPCIEKRAEAEEAESVDYVLTFKEFYKWLQMEKIDLENLESRPFDAEPPEWARFSVFLMEIHGIKESKAFLEGFPQNSRKGKFIELLGCRGGCLNGHGMLGRG